MSSVFSIANFNAHIKPARPYREWRRCTKLLHRVNWATEVVYSAKMIRAYVFHGVWAINPATCGYRNGEKRDMPHRMLEAMREPRLCDECAERPAACIGYYDGSCTAIYSCADCCDHDGICTGLTPLNEVV